MYTAEEVPYEDDDLSLLAVRDGVKRVEFDLYAPFVFDAKMSSLAQGLCAGYLAVSLVVDCG